MKKHQSDEYGETYIITQKDFCNVADNIATLRKKHFESQTDLAMAINVATSAISNYETHKRNPSREELLAIAKHYNITVAQLLYGGFSSINHEIIGHILINDQHNVMKILDVLLPGATSDEAEENEHFKKALDLHHKIFDKHIQLKELASYPEHLAETFLESLSKEWEICKELYEKAADDGVFDAYANLLWFPMFWSITLAAYLGIADVSIKVDNDTTVMDMLKHILFSVDNVEDENSPEAKERKMIQEERFKEFLPEIYTNLYALKCSGDAALNALADYYIAIGYLFNVFKTTLTREESRLMGHELLRTCIILKNPYAEDFFHCLDTN